MRTWFITANQYLTNTTGQALREQSKAAGAWGRIRETRGAKPLQNRDYSDNTFFNLTYIFSTFSFNFQKLKKNLFFDFFSSKNKTTIFPISKSIAFLVKLKITFFLFWTFSELFEVGKGRVACISLSGKTRSNMILSCGVKLFVL